MQPTVQFTRTSATGDLHGGMLGVLVPESTFTRRYTVPSRPTPSAGKAISGESSKRDSGLMVEEEPAEWFAGIGLEERVRMLV